MAKQSANGWESELRICIDSILLFQPIYTLIAQFQQQYPWINIRVTEEVFGGTWDSLLANRTDLIIGATGEPYNSDFAIQSLGDIDFVFAIAKNHPLFNEQQPVSNKTIKQYPSVVVADSSRNQPGQSARLLDGQSRITVPTVEKKIEAHLLGLGVGYLPIHRIKEQLESGELVTLELASYENRNSELSMAWRKDNKGKALAWFVNNIQQMAIKLI
jgi:DNA-binding transcriptional LysR family regulator